MDTWFRTVDEKLIGQMMVIIPSGLMSDGISVGTVIEGIWLAKSYLFIK